jgi:Zn-dependent membrane protease YugP
MIHDASLPGYEMAWSELTMPASMDAACIAAWSLAQGFQGKRCIRLLRDVLDAAALTFIDLCQAMPGAHCNKIGS